MRKVLLLAAVIVFSQIAISQQSINGVKVITGQLIRITPALKDIKSDPSYTPPVTRDLTGLIRKKTWKEEIVDYGTSAKGDPVVQKDFFNPKTNGLNNPNEGPLAGTKVIQNYDGMGFTNVAPADPCLTNGPNHVIQMINGSQGSYFRVWDKTGANVVAQTYMNVLFPVNAANEYWGDPIVMYDQFADRYIITEFAAWGNNGGFANTLLFAVSQTNNPAGSWYVYSFQDNTVFIDYPKFGVWPDAIYGTSRDFNTAGTAYLGQSIMAFDKAKMIAGQPTSTMIRLLPFVNPVPSSKQQTMAPISISGPSPPPAGTPGHFLFYHDDNLTSSTTDVDSLGILTLKPDFTTPANTVVSFLPSFTVAAFKSNVCASRACVPGGAGYDAISSWFMHRVSYRNFGTHEAIVANHTVDANYPALPAKSGIRWYELRRSGGGNWGVHQQGTYAPDGDSRWMGGININSKGQIALAFNHSGEGKFASIYFTGRNSTDPPGLMVYDEGTIQVGTAYGTFGNRWGDYNDLETDVTNDSVFWFTAMYGATEWRTKIASFKLEALPSLDARLLTIISPSQGLAQCDSIITPSITIRNSGTTTLTSLNIYRRLNNGVVSTPVNWTGSLATGQTVTVPLPNITAAIGANTLRIWLAEPNGGADENTVNDTALSTFTILTPQPGPFIEGFESTAFPPPSWRVVNPNIGSITWQRTTAARKSGVASAFIDFYNYSGGNNHRDFLLSPVLDVTVGADSVILSFERAYRLYSTQASAADSLAIVVSTDCGLTFTEVWKRGGAALATVAGTQTSVFVPTATQWVNTRLDLKPFIGNAASVTVGFRATNKFGNNLYLDDINLRKIRVPNRDALVRAVTEPSSRLCTRTFVPQITLGNQGKDTLKNVKILYRIGTGALDSIAWTGSLPIGGSAAINFATYNKSITLTTGGNYVFTVYTKDPNGLNDENNLNDTTRINFTVFDPQPDPVKEGFEQATFPPANWSVASSGSAYTWERNVRAANEKTASAWIRNYRFNSNNRVDDLYSPLVQVATPDSVTIRFDVAHSTGRFPGSTGVPLDTLELLLTTDCGKTFRSIYKKWGEDLTTVDKNFPSTFPTTDTVGFVPTSPVQWRTEWLDLSKFVPANSRFQVVFRSTSNRGNNTFLDKIDISTVTLPARLKQNGYMIAPNPFEGSFSVRHVIPPISLRGIQVINSSGQTVVARSFDGNASNNIVLDLSRYANGAYQVKLIYDNKVITERIIKRR